MYSTYKRKDSLNMFFVLARMKIRLQKHCDALGSRKVLGDSSIL
jgi:hypothetical protein